LAKSFRPFNEVLQHFAIERSIYRLSKSPHADRFILKGALMFSAWSELTFRTTMDIDLLGRIDNSIEVIVGGNAQVLIRCKASSCHDSPNVNEAVYLKTCPFERTGAYTEDGLPVMP